MSARPSDVSRRDRGAHAEFARQMRERGYSDEQIHDATPRPLRSLRLQPAAEAVLVSVSGRRISLAEPCPATICADDIAHGLSHVCRFSGQVREFYSVAQHSILVASLVPLRLRKHALLHDGSEAFLQDVPTPVKVLLPTYALLEARFQRAIEASFGLSPLSGEDARAIKRADLQVLSVEMRDLFGGHFEADRAELPPAPAGMRIAYGMPPVEAKAALLACLAGH